MPGRQRSVRGSVGHVPEETISEPKRRPLPPLTRGRAWFMRVCIVVWFVIAVERVAQAATGHDVVFSVVLAVFSGALSAGYVWELRRRSDPARTAGWGPAGRS